MPLNQPLLCFTFLMVLLGPVRSLPGLSTTSLQAFAEETGEESEAPDPEETEKVEVAEKVEVVPENSDVRIAGRLTGIMEATGWFLQHDVNVDEGVVFLDGVADTESHRQWAEQTAIRTSDVVAVVNKIQLRKNPLFDLAPAQASLRTLTRDFLTTLPLAAVALFVIGLFYFLARGAAFITRRVYRPQSDSKLLRHVVASVVAVFVFMVGLHIALRISGLSRLATTLLGGTGLVGLAIGFAFRDIAENFLASILLSLHQPFRVGDLIEVDNTKGFVRKVTTRATVLVSFDGNQVQIPNSTIYKGKITNFTATPLSRLNFSVGIGYTDSAQQAQELIMQILRDHPAVELSPEPLVVVDSLGNATVNLKCLYWFNQRRHSGARVNSALIRQVKQELMDVGISMPDESRELVFPSGVPVTLVDSSLTNLQFPESTSVQDPNRRKKKGKKTNEPKSSTGEGDLHSEEADLSQAMGDEDQAEQENILPQPARKEPTARGGSKDAG